MIRSQKVTSHAKGQPCQLALPGICSHDPETTVFAHLNGAAFGKGSGQKAHDIAGFFSCYRCHYAYDQHMHGLSSGDMNAMLLKAVIGTWLILIRDGIIIVPQDAVTPKTIKPRKPPSQRASVPQRKTEWPSRPFPRRIK